MSLKKNLAFTILILVPCCYAACLLKLPFVLIIFLVSLFYLPVFFLLAKIIHVFLPKETKQKFEKRQIGFYFVILWCLVLLAFGREVLSDHYMSGSVYLVKFPAKLALLAFTMFYCWTILKSGWKKGAVICTIIYLLFIVVPIIKASVAYVSDTDDKSSVKKLDTLGYVDWVHDEKDIDKVSVTTYEANLTCDGLNIYTLLGSSVVFLIDMEGNVVHEWELDIDNEFSKRWIYANFSENGDILTYCKESIFTRVDWESNRVWVKEMKAHHGFYVDQNRDIYALNRKDSAHLWNGLPVPLIEDYITVLSPNGEFKKNILFFKTTTRRLTAQEILKIYKYILKPDNIKILLKNRLLGESLVHVHSIDAFHTNSAFVIERDIEGLCTKGDILLSMRDINLVAILNPETQEFVWEWGPGDILSQHHATMLDNNNILLFDNGYGRGYSRVIEIDPITKEIQWEYRGEPFEDFYSPRRGSCQRLPNGNTLITDSESGSVFEVTPDCKIVWKFYVPEIDKETNRRRPLYRMVRVTNPQEYPHLKDL